MTQSSTDAIIEIRHVSKQFGDFTALDDVSLTIGAGEFFALLGPSGCGKSTLLRIIAGFDSPTHGTLLLDGADMTEQPPNKRPVNMVFQSYAVFPHMTAGENVAYGLKMQKYPRAQIEHAVDAALAQVHLSEYKHRRPEQLSGGQLQRVALARALVKKPRVLLLDEPLSALDAKLRETMRGELVKLQHSVGVSFIMVTHDQAEAMAMASRIAVLEHGRLQQVDTPQTLYHRPNNVFVADFIGRVNLFEIASLTRTHRTIQVDLAQLGTVTLPATALSPAAAHTEPADLALAIRPEYIRLTRRLARIAASDAPSPTQINWCGTVSQIAYQGERALVEVTLTDGTRINTFITSDLTAFTHGEAVHCLWPPEHALLIPRT